MKRIIYLSPFSQDQISGGIKVMFKHVEMLRSIGFDACVYCPAGRPKWLSTDAPLYSGDDLFSNPGHVLVFPECLNGNLASMAKTPAAGLKFLLCQNQYYAFCEAVPNQSYAELGFSKCLTVGQRARSFLERVFAPAVFDVVPVWVDADVFFPREKTPSIAVFPRKLPYHFTLIRRIFQAKYPGLRSVQWRPIQNKSEAETAAILGASSVFLSLCNLECCPLSPLEAMASGCLVAGFHGYGGLEYATSDNGIWLPPDHLEETADALAKLVVADARGDPEAARRREKGLATAGNFNRARTMSELDRLFRPFFEPDVLSGIDEWLRTLP